MKVLKKDGILQEYDLSKIKLSIERASDEVEQPLTLSDIEILSKDVQDKIMELGKDVIKTSEIHDIVYEKLKDNGFGKIAQRYVNYAKRATEVL